MSEFAVVVEEIVIKEHPNADAIEIGQIRGYQAIVKKGEFRTGDLVAYIPEASLVPESILEEMGLVGRLAGSQKNRVKAIRLRGVLSQGLCYPVHEGWEKGQDVTEELGVKKYEPPIPTCLSGQVWYAGGRRTLKYDIQNWKNHPEVIQDGEQVVFTEKIHGTFMGVALLPDVFADEQEGNIAIFSKGLGAGGKAMKRHAPANEKNLYVRTFKLFEENFRRGFGALQTKDDSGKLMFPPESPVFILGEVFGKGVQDLSYGYDSGTDRIGYRVFDVYIGHRDLGRYLNDDELDVFCSGCWLDRVPVLYRGPFYELTMEQYTNGKETLTGKMWNIREGIVMRPVVERRDLELGRVILKSVSGKYLTRKGGTEHN